METSMGGWVITRRNRFWQRTPNAQHSDAVGEWIEDPHCASVFHGAERAQQIADEVGGEPYDFAAACEAYNTTD